MRFTYHYILIFVLLFTGNTVLAQNQLSQADYIIQYPQGFQYSALNGAGYSLHFHPSATNIGAINPAALTAIRGSKVGIAYQYTSAVNSVPVLNGSTYSFAKYDNWLPQSLGMTFQLKNIHLSLGYQQFYNLNSELKSPNTVLYRLENGVMTAVDTVTMIIAKKYLISEFNVSGAVQFKDVIHSDDELTFGASVILPRIDMFKQIIPYPNKLSDTGYGLRITAGTIYSTSKMFKVGLFYELGRNNQHTYSFDSDIDVRWEAEYPDQIHFGLSLIPMEKIGLNGNVSYLSGNKLYWGKHFEFNGAVQYHCKPELSLSAGAFTNHWQTDVPKTNSLVTERPNQAVFLTLGASYQVHSFLIDFAIADSHLAEKKLRRQTIVKMGIVYNLSGK